MVTLLLLLTTFSLFCFYWSMNSFWKRLGIPEIRGLPIVGNLLPIITKKAAYFQIMEDLYKHGVGNRYIGIYNSFEPALLLRDPELIDIIFKEEARNFEDRGLCSDTSDPMSLNLFFLKGKLWKWTRSKLRPAFSNARLKMVYGGIEMCSEKCIDSLGLSVNLKQEMNKFTCDVIAKTIFCLQDHSGFIENSHKVFSLSGFQGIAAFLRIFVPRFALSVGIKTVPLEIENFYRNAIARSKRVPGSFLDLMLHLKETEPDFNDDLMLSQFFIFILAGFETTSTALTFALYLLSKNPQVQKKARVEIDGVFKEHGKSFDSLKKMTYLEFIINETMRLFPPVSGIIRIAEKAFKLPCGAVLPAGSAVSISTFAIQRDCRFYKNPLHFIPERWEKPHRVFYPFGIGPRICIGIYKAIMKQYFVYY